MTCPLVNLDGLCGAYSFTATTPVALGLVCDPAHLVRFVNKQDFLGADLDAGTTARAQFLINNHNLVHNNLTSANIVFMDQPVKWPSTYAVRRYILS
jgi:hypothetical protein